ncbi:MAG: efflux RND transporter permease subunit [Bradymonadaceae bacterium]
MRDLTYELRALDRVKDAQSVATIGVPRQGDLAGTMTVEPILGDLEAMADAGGLARPVRGPPLTTEDVAALTSLATSEPLLAGRLVSTDRRLAAVLLWIEESVQDIEEIQAVVQSLEETLEVYTLPRDYGYQVNGIPESREQVEQLHLLISDSPDSREGVGRFVTGDFRNVRVLIRVGDVGAKALLGMTTGLEETLAELFPPESDVRYHITGDAYVASAALDSFIRDLFFSLLLAIVIIFFMITLVFRSLKLGLISLIPNCMPLIVTIGYMGIVGVDLNATTVIIFAISLGIAVDDSIHFFARFKEEQDRHDDVRDAILATYFGAGRAILLTSVLLLTGLAVLMMSDFTPTAQFGLLTNITIGGAVVADLVVLPALLYLVYGKKEIKAAH